MGDDDWCATHDDAEELAWARAACADGDASREVPQPRIDGLRCGTCGDFWSSALLRGWLAPATAAHTYAWHAGRDFALLAIVYALGMAWLVRGRAVEYVDMLGFVLTWVLTAFALLPALMRAVYAVRARREHATARKRCWRAAQLIALSGGEQKARPELLAWLEARVGPPLPLAPPA